MSNHPNRAVQHLAGLGLSSHQLAEETGVISQSTAWRVMAGKYPPPFALIEACSERFGVEAGWWLEAPTAEGPEAA